MFVIQNLKFGTLPCHLVIMVKSGTYKQNWDFFWDQNLGLYSLTKSKVSPLDNVVQKQALRKSIQIWKFPLGKETHNDKLNWIEDYTFFVIIYTAIDQGYMGLSLASCHKDEIWDLRAELGLIWDHFRALVPIVTKS